MIVMRYTLAGVLLLVVATAPVVPAAQAAKQAQATQQKMPVSYVCTMPGDEDVVEDKPGNCRKCNMQLQPVRIESAWSCANNTSIIKDNPGKCPVDGRDLVPITVAHFFVCNDAPKQFFPDGGKCADGSARVERREIRAHGDHNPVHGGQFFMASDSWHHVEGTYPSSGLFRMFFYDNFKKPLAGKGFSGTLVVLDKADKEVASVPLASSRDGNTLEARIAPALAALPLKTAAKIKIDRTAPEQRFDFVFTEISKDPAPSAPAATTTGAAGGSRQAPPATKPAAPATAGGSPARPTPSGTTAARPVAEPPKPATPPVAQAPPAQTPLILDSPTQIPPALADALDESKLPSATPELLAELTRRAKEVETLVDEGNLSQVWLPATGTKTVALVLDSHSTSLPARQRMAVSASVKRIVTAAWELDAYGDLGNRRKITEAYQRLAAAITDLKAAYGR